MRRGVLHPEVLAILEPLAGDLARALEADGRADLAAVLLAPGREVPLDHTETSPAGVRWALMPRTEALALGREHTLECGELLAEELAPREAWVLLLGSQGAAAAPLVWSPSGPSSIRAMS